MSPSKSAQLLTKARRIREEEHRLRPSLKLTTLREIKEFVHGRGLVSVLGGNELPSVINAILGREWKPSRKGFTGWLDWWNIKISGQNAGRALVELELDAEIVSTRIFRNSKTLLSEKIWPILDPIVKHHATMAKGHEILKPLSWKIFDLLEDEGPLRTDRIRTELKLKGKENTGPLHKALSNLENYAIIIGHEDPHPETHLHANIWQLWKERVAPMVKGKATPSYNDALLELLARTLDAAVLAYPRAVEKWFPWERGLPEAEEMLIDTGRALQVDDFLVTPRVGQSD